MWKEQGGGAVYNFAFSIPDHLAMQDNTTGLKQRLTLAPALFFKD